MYEIYKNGLSMGLIEEQPTQEQLEELGCDSYEEYQEPQESEEAKKIRIRKSLVSYENIESFDTEWVQFSDIEIGDIIVERVFGGNPHAQTALQAKYLASLTNKVFWVELTEDEAIFARADEVRIQINAIRNKLSLDSI